MSEALERDPGDFVTRREMALLVRMYERGIARVDARVDAMDTAGTRAAGVIAERATELRAELNELRGELRAYRDDYEQRIAEDISLRRQVRQWRIVTLLSTGSLLLSIAVIVLHFLGLY